MYAHKSAPNQVRSKLHTIRVCVYCVSLIFCLCAFDVFVPLSFLCTLGSLSCGLGRCCCRCCCYRCWFYFLPFVGAFYYAPFYEFASHAFECFLLVILFVSTWFCLLSSDFTRTTFGAVCPIVYYQICRMCQHGTYVYHCNAFYWFFFGQYSTCGPFNMSRWLALTLFHSYTRLTKQNTCWVGSCSLMYARCCYNWNYRIYLEKDEEMVRCTLIICSFWYAKQ